MPSGGARSRSGPAPDPTALRRLRKSDAAEWTTLPLAGREGEPPRWPLPRATKRELAVWAALWVKPQAVAWESEGDDTLLIALYARMLVEAEVRYETAAKRTVVRQFADELGITSSGMARRRWKLAKDELAPRREEERPAGRASSRDRLTVIKPAAASGD